MNEWLFQFSKTVYYFFCAFFQMIDYLEFPHFIFSSFCLYRNWQQKTFYYVLMFAHFSSSFNCSCSSSTIRGTSSTPSPAPSGRPNLARELSSFLVWQASIRRRRIRRSGSCPTWQTLNWLRPIVVASSVRLSPSVPCCSLFRVCHAKKLNKKLCQFNRKYSYMCTGGERGFLP